ncbi:MAG: serine/threonine protein kinase [Oscillospiraceae bacterium]|nr:serine/threonine protein kinase [Oscillospiraceae bacterium]
MTLEESARLSYYQEIAELNEQHGVVMVQHVGSKRVFVKKTLTVYDVGVFRYLQMNPVPHTPRIYEAVEDRGKLIVIEEYIDGTSLASLLDARGTLSEQETVYIAMQVCSILRSFEHVDPPLVHRDIKPSNIMLSDTMEVTLLDMDAAKHQNMVEYQDTQLIGTFGYAAPEQYGFGSSDTRTDIYALGVLMNVMLTGKTQRESPAGGRLGQIITKCTQLDAKDRYQNADELMDAFKAVSGSNTVRQVEKVDKRDTGWELPGFRGTNKFAKVMAGIGYGLLALGCLNIQLDETEYPLLMANRIFSFLATMSFILVLGNYRDVWTLLGVDKIKAKSLRWFAAIFLASIAFYIWVSVLLIIEKIFA